MKPLGMPESIRLCEQDVVLYHGTGEWSACYVDGELVDYGDHDVLHERLFEALGIPEEFNNDFLGANSQVLRTIDDVLAYRADRVLAQRQAAEKRAQAAALEAEAKG